MDNFSVGFRLNPLMNQSDILIVCGTLITPLINVHHKYISNIMVDEKSVLQSVIRTR